MATTKKYGESAKKHVKKAMHKLKEGTLKTGTGKKVTSKKQAVAIGLSEAREKGGKVPAKKKSSKKSSNQQRPAAKRNVGRPKGAKTKSKSSK